MQAVPRQADRADQTPHNLRAWQDRVLLATWRRIDNGKQGQGRRKRRPKVFSHHPSSGGDIQQAHAVAPSGRPEKACQGDQGRGQEQIIVGGFYVKVLPASFYHRSTEQVAKELVGKVLVRNMLSGGKSCRLA